MGRALIVSAGASSNEYISARLAELGYTRPTIIPSGAEARRRMLESDFELIVVNSPLPDEFGHELLSKPFSTAFFVQAMHMAAASNHRLQLLRQENARMQEKIAQVRLVSHAKCCLVEREQMSEDAAHRYIEKRAMDTRRSRAEIAQEILDSYED